MQCTGYSVISIISSTQLICRAAQKQRSKNTMITNKIRRLILSEQKAEASFLCPTRRRRCDCVGLANGHASVWMYMGTWIYLRVRRYVESRERKRAGTYYGAVASPVPLSRLEKLSVPLYGMGFGCALSKQNGFLISRWGSDFPFWAEQLTIARVPSSASRSFNGAPSFLCKCDPTPTLLSLSPVRWAWKAESCFGMKTDT